MFGTLLIYIHIQYFCLFIPFPVLVASCCLPFLPSSLLSFFMCLVPFFFCCLILNHSPSSIFLSIFFYLPFFLFSFLFSCCFSLCPFVCPSIHSSFYLSLYQPLSFFSPSFYPSFCPTVSFIPHLITFYSRYISDQHSFLSFLSISSSLNHSFFNSAKPFSLAYLPGV